MNQIVLQKATNNYSVATVGDLNSFAGKVFFREVVGATSMEVSLGSLEEGQSVPFFHRHEQNEELYIVISGKGVFTLDDEEIEVEAGSIVRIAPSVNRCNRNTGKTPFVYLCIQAKDNSLVQSVAEDTKISK